MIVIFEGPRVAGKTTLVEKVGQILESWELPVQRWKDERGKEPIADMNTILDEGIFTDNTIWLLDRFHMSEWVISKATRKAAYPGSQWTFYEAGLQALDERLAKRDAFVIFVVSSPWILDQRRTKTGKKDTIGESQQALFWWNNQMSKTTCNAIRVINDRTNLLDNLASMLADFIYARWKRFGPTSPVITEAVDMGAIATKISFEPTGPVGDEPEKVEVEVKEEETDYEALEKEHLGDAEKKTGIYAEKEGETEEIKIEVKEEKPKDDIPF